ncbi:MAG TPA: hypothetical protein VD793_08735, partial [Gemmatimonadales bacterium]|nr:hypothetical protein [Gemmatimonadales bacterium]
TDGPGNGYAVMPEIPGEAVTWQPAGPAWSADGAMLRVELDRDSGAIRSLVGRADGTEWVQASPGFNALPGARVERCEGAALPGVATRLVADRRMASGATLRSTVTAYHRLPWVDVWNEILPPASPLLDIRFALATPATSVEWEIPAGSLESGVPAEFTWLRWLRLSSDTGSLMIGGLEAPVATVNGDGLLVTKPAGPTAAFRLAVQPRGQDRWREDPWRHGWSMEPLLSAPVTGAGRITLPSFGSLLTTSDPGAVIIGMEPDDDFTLVVYLQELLGLSRTVAVRSAVMRFREARLADLVGRDRAPLDARDGEVRLELRAHGVTAIRLRQVTTSSA